MISAFNMSNHQEIIIHENVDDFVIQDTDSAASRLKFEYSIIPFKFSFLCSYNSCRFPPPVSLAFERNVFDCTTSSFNLFSHLFRLLWRYDNIIQSLQDLRKCERNSAKYYCWCVGDKTKRLQEVVFLSYLHA